jgi:hypothetical protein
MKTKTAFTLLVFLGIFLISSVELRAQIIVNQPLPDIGSLIDIDGETTSRKGGFNIEKSTSRLKLSISSF